MPRCALLQILLLLVFASGMNGCGQPASEADADVRVRVDRIGLDAEGGYGVPVLVLDEEAGSRSLSIWIGHPEARSIALQMESRSVPRPNTHDLARSVIDGLDGEVERIVVTDLRNGTFYASLSLRVANRIIEIDSRPSDAIAIALRSDAPIYVRESVFEKARAAHAGDTGETADTPVAGREI